jgi:chromosome partitioning protein
MDILAVISQKGGAGKTTLALHLAVAAERAGRPAAVIDLDPQASAAAWKDTRPLPAPAVVAAPPARLGPVLEAAAGHGARLAVIDTAPHSESAALAAARAADLVVIPCRPAILDLRAIGATIDLVRLARRPAVVVLNAAPPRGGLAEDAAQAVAAWGVPVAPVVLVQRAAYVHALTAGLVAQEHEPQGKAADEISQLYRWICGHVDEVRRNAAAPRIASA